MLKLKRMKKDTLEKLTKARDLMGMTANCVESDILEGVLNYKALHCSLELSKDYFNLIKNIDGIEHYLVEAIDEIIEDVDKIFDIEDPALIYGSILIIFSKLCDIVKDLESIEEAEKQINFEFINEVLSGKKSVMEEDRESIEEEKAELKRKYDERLDAFIDYTTEKIISSIGDFLLGGLGEDEPHDIQELDIGDGLTFGDVVHSAEACQTFTIPSRSDWEKKCSVEFGEDTIFEYSGIGWEQDDYVINFITYEITTGDWSLVVGDTPKGDSNKLYFEICNIVL